VHRLHHAENNQEKKLSNNPATPQQKKGFGVVVWGTITVALLLVNYVAAFAIERQVAQSASEAVIGALQYALLGPLVLGLLYLIPKANRTVRHYLKAVSMLAAILICVSIADMGKAAPVEKVGFSERELSHSTIA
jgi:hypothetical protein